MAIKDNPSVLQIIGEFNEFIADGKDSETSTSVSLPSIATRLNFEDSNLTWDMTKTQQSAVARTSRTTTIATQTSPEGPRLSFRDSLKRASTTSLVSKLETEVGALTTSNKRARIEFDQEMELARIDHKKDKEKLEDTEMELRRLREKHVQSRQEFVELRKMSDSVKSSLERKLSALQREKMSVEEKYAEENSILRETISELNISLNQQQHEKELALQESEELRDQLSIHARATEEFHELRMELEECKSQLLLSELKAKEIEDELVKNDENSRLAQIFHPQLNRVPKLEKKIKELQEENKILRQHDANVLLLEEQIEGLRNALARSEKRCADMIHLQFENEELKKRVSRWESLDSSRSPEVVAKQIGELQQKEIMWLAKFGEQKSKLSALIGEKKDLENKIQSCKQNSQKEEKNLQLNSELIKRLQKKLLLVTKERDSYQRVLQSYENEVTVNIPVATQERVHTLENVIEGYRSQLEKAETDLAAANKKLQNGDQCVGTSVLGQKTLLDNKHELEDRYSELEKKNQLLQETVVEMEKVNSSLRQENEGLKLRIEHRALKGDYDPMATKVVHFKLNPLAVAQKGRENDLERLQKENKALRERMRLLLEDGKEAASELTAKVEQNLQSHAGTTKELEDLREQVTAAELKNKRLMEAFSEKSQEFREVCYMLIGYRIDMISTRQYKVTSMYAENADDFLIFKLSSKGDMQLLETPFSKHMSVFIDSFLQRQNSIPAFLSSVTLDLFSQQTTV